jgi:hypothetical protein
MTSRQRTLAIIAVVAIALAAYLFYFISERSRITAMEESLATFVTTPAFTDVRARCQSDPAKLGPIPGPDRDAPAFEVFAYDGEFHPADQNAPVFSPELADKMRGKLSAFGRYSSADGSGVELGIATPWRNGNCALILVRLSSKR